MTVLFYWLALVPPVYKYCTKNNYVESSINELPKCIKTNFIFVLVAVIGYVAVYRLVMLAYAELKAIDKMMINKMTFPANRDSRKSKKKTYSMDVADSVEMGTIKDKTSFPHCEKNEDIQVGIHVKKETKLASSVHSCWAKNGETCSWKVCFLFMCSMFMHCPIN